MCSWDKDVSWSPAVRAFLEPIFAGLLLDQGHEVLCADNFSTEPAATSTIFSATSASKFSATT